MGKILKKYTKVRCRKKVKRAYQSEAQKKFTRPKCQRLYERYGDDDFSLMTSATSSQTILQWQATTYYTQTVSARRRIRSSTSRLKSMSQSFSCGWQYLSKE